jgi:hypothetical protein
MPPLRPLRRGPLDSHCSMASAAPMSCSNSGAVDPVGCWIKLSPTGLATSALAATQLSVVEPPRGGWLPALSVASLWLPPMWGSGETSLCLQSACGYVAPPCAAGNCRAVACARVAPRSEPGRPHTGGPLGGEVPANVSLPSSGGEGRSQSLLPCPGSRNVHRQDTCPGAARGVRVRPQRLHARSLRYQSIAPGIPLLHVEHQRLRFASVCVLHVACLTLHLIHCALAAGSALTQEMCGSAPLAFGVGPSVHRPLHTLRALRAPARCCVTGCLEPRPFLVAPLTHPHPAGSNGPRPSPPPLPLPGRPLPAAGVAGLRLASPGVLPKRNRGRPIKPSQQQAAASWLWLQQQIADRVTACST